ncbi:adenosine deaminase [Xylona heveae TC161]|uniref:Adenine deaminase n=1 Tax=Xylona heveae (strain CBS 132557 / TC161) TaxID=1328760 RepID=A0A165HYF5_XYLHT|nr:adenosine deaminase [Xylona heveae TC161]KZF24100.1 adenosine deaminase [Xylona heveae TC161]
MSHHTIQTFLRALPKCEHHLHIEGSLSPDLLFDLAARNKIQLPSANDDPAFASPETLLERYEHFSSLDDFLHYYYIGMSVLLHESDFHALAYAYLRRAHHDGVMHAEMFFDPQAHTERGIDLDTVVRGLRAGCAAAESEFGISTQLIMCFLRHLPATSAHETLKAARAAIEDDGSITGIGLDSSEKPFPPQLFESVYAEAQGLQAAATAGMASNGSGRLRLTAHAGEEADPSYIRQAVDLLGVERIDHGIRLAEDESLLKRIAETKTMLTVCPLSNVRLQCVKSVAELPLRKFLDAGVRFSLNSDDPAYFGGYILDNYYAVQDAFKLSVEEWERVATAGIEGSWCNQARKAEMLACLKEVIREYIAGEELKLPDQERVARLQKHVRAVSTLSS